MQIFGLDRHDLVPKADRLPYIRPLRIGHGERRQGSAGQYLIFRSSVKRKLNWQLSPHIQIVTYSKTTASPLNFLFLKENILKGKN